MSDLRRFPEPVLARLEARYGPHVMELRARGWAIDHRGHTLEHRATKGVEVRQDEEDESTAQPVIAGYATTYDQPYDMFGGPEKGGWSETVAAGAADRSVKNQDDVYSFFDHSGLPLGRSSAGTLTLESQKLGLWTETAPDMDSPYSKEIVSRVQRGELDAMSFAFQVLAEDWDDEFTSRTIREVKLFDVSVVSFPANPHTVAGMLGDEDLVPRSVGRSLRLARAQRDRLVS